MLTALGHLINDLQNGLEVAPTPEQLERLRDEMARAGLELEQTSMGYRLTQASLERLKPYVAPDRPAVGFQSSLWPPPGHPAAAHRAECGRGNGCVCEPVERSAKVLSFRRER